VVILNPSVPMITFAYKTNTWTQVNKTNSLGALVANNANEVKLVPSGVTGSTAGLHRIAFSASGNVMAVGGISDNSGLGATWVFTRNPSTLVWSQQAKIVGTGSTGGTVQQGFVVCLSADGATLATSGPSDNSNIGSVWVFTQSGGIWTQQAMLLPTGHIGTSKLGTGLALSADGNVLAAGAPADNSTQGSTYMYTRAAGVWTQQQRFVGSDTDSKAQFGNNVAMSADGKTVAVTAFTDNTDVGACTIFASTDLVTWTQVGSKFIGSGVVAGYFFGGGSNRMSADGQTLSIASEDGTAVGTTYVFSLPNNTPSEIVKLIGTNGISAFQSMNTLSADGSILAVGAQGNNSNLGAVWEFRRGSNHNWSQYAEYLALSETGNGKYGTDFGLNADGSVLGVVASDDNTIGATFIYQ